VIAVVMVVSPTLAAEVTPERLVNADREPQNWLMNHRTYDRQRFSPLARINRDNVKNLKLAFVPPPSAAGIRNPSQFPTS
jgi:alcohol dehydrogenase (cytochrome c)